MFLTLPKKAQNLAGQRFGCLVALGLVEVRRYPGVTHMIWLCKCECGNETKVSAGRLRTGQSKSCGCMKSKWCADANIKHGFADRD